MAELVTRLYSNFRGADFRGEEINLVRSPDCLNVYKDYKETESIRTRPALESLEKFEDTVYGIFFYTVGDITRMLVHSGTRLFCVLNGEKTELCDGLNEMRSDAFVYNNIWYFKDGKHYLMYDGRDIKDVEGYIPTTSIARKSKSGGTIYEDVNMLSDYRMNTFLADGESRLYYLDAMNIDEDFAPVVKVDGKEVFDFVVDYDNGWITFTTAPPKPLTDGQDNIVVKYKKTVDGYRDKILKCTLLQVFDNRVFFSGNKDYPNTIFHCSLNDPSYCSDLDYYTEGLDSAMVKGLVAGNNVLWVFKEPSQANTTVFYHVPTIDSEYGKIYPSTHSSVSTGCVGKAINFNDDIVFFSERGMEGINGDITTEQVVAHRSSLVDRKLTAEEDYRDMILEEWDGYLVVIIGNKAYLADSRAMVAIENHNEYEWFYWDLGEKITCAKVKDGILYLGTKNGVYTLTDTEGNVESYWVTPKDKAQNANKLKTTNKRGCVAEATGDVTLYAKTEKTDFEYIGTFNNVTDYFVGRIKRKKFKDIQLKFQSSSRFSLETVTLEFFIGGYVKR